MTSARPAPRLAPVLERSLALALSPAEAGSAATFREALDDYLAEKARYQLARAAHGDNYDWDYFGGSAINSLKLAADELDQAFVSAVKEVAASLVEQDSAPHPED